MSRIRCSTKEDDQDSKFYIWPPWPCREDGMTSPVSFSIGDEETKMVPTVSHSYEIIDVGNCTEQFPCSLVLCIHFKA